MAAVAKPLHPVVQTLEEHIRNTSGWTQRFEDAVKTSHNSGIIEMQKITTLSEYLSKINEWLYCKSTSDMIAFFDISVSSVNLEEIVLSPQCPQGFQKKTKTVETYTTVSASSTSS